MPAFREAGAGRRFHGVFALAPGEIPLAGPGGVGSGWAGAGRAGLDPVVGGGGLPRPAGSRMQAASGGGWHSSYGEATRRRSWPRTGWSRTGWPRTGWPRTGWRRGDSITGSTDPKVRATALAHYRYSGIYDAR
ncbi:hypothetical protein JCM4914_15240 [Streptomyces platensis subsp. malvinus]